MQIAHESGTFCSCYPCQLVAVHLVDSHYCSDPGKFVSVLLTSLSTMVQVELPHINILSKVDLIEQYGRLGKHYSLGDPSASFPPRSTGSPRLVVC